LSYVIKVESAINFGSLFDEALEHTNISTLHHPDYNNKEKKILEAVDD
jgi:hypothetical protein